MTEKIKIMFFLPDLSGGGAERVAVNMLRLLDSKKFDISLVLVNKIGEYIDIIPEHIKIYDLGLKKTIFSIVKLRKMVKELQPNVIFSTLFRTHKVVYLALLGIKKKPTVILRSPNSPKLLLENHQLGMFSKYLLEKAYNNANLILAQTPEMKEEIVKYHNIHEDKVQVFLNPIDIDQINHKLKNIITPFNSHKINVVAAGRLTRQKGFDVLIKAFKKVVAKNNSFMLHIIGKDDGYKEQLERLVHSLELEENVYFWDFQKNPYRFFYFSDLYVLSSRWEGLPNTVLENLYLNNPVIATRCISFMDTLIKDGQNGLLIAVDNENSLAQAILDYKKINVNYKTINFDHSMIDSIFDTNNF